MRSMRPSWFKNFAAIGAMLPYFPALNLIGIPEAPTPRAAPRDYRGKPSRYMPHQGERECARRRRQMEKAKLKESR